MMVLPHFSSQLLPHFRANFWANFCYTLQPTSVSI